MVSNTSLQKSTRTPEQQVESGNETIVALATPAGRGGIAIVRLSGSLAKEIAVAITGTVPRPRQAHLCEFKDQDGGAIDRGLALYFETPNSYTGEAVLELHAHGSPVVSELLVRRCLELGCRMARPGEFSERAFLSGQLDLAQAEAVADLIESSTESAARSAIRSLQGAFSERIYQLVEGLTHLRIYVEASIDFPEEEIDFLNQSEVKAQLSSLQNDFSELRKVVRQGKLLRDGLKVVLSGVPNAGKSSLLNLLSREQRAIVSDIPGTTRDVLEQHLELDGLPVVLLDTAGIRDSTDSIEAEGVRRAREAQQSADLVLQIIDSSQSDEGIVDNALDLPNGVQVLTVYNKIDLSGKPASIQEDAVFLSALTGEGLDLLVDYLKRVAGYRETDSSQFIARQRHIDALDRARAHLETGVAQLVQYQAGELLAEELRLAQQALGEITGEVTSDELLGRIFGSFCIGK
ncbi:MAG: tRNA uridine-5-carboxymethylaminomethyl(34) synthesis GTPase MnmE [bacterium]